MIAFDHIALAADTLENGNDRFTALTGLSLPVGGKHPRMGTHNLVTSTGPDTYIELISIDPDAGQPETKRWFDMDTRPVHDLHLRALMFRSDDIAGDLVKASGLGVDLGQSWAMSRGDLTWSVAVREDGIMPLAGTAPGLLQWDTPDRHPAAGMADLGIRIGPITVTTPEPGLLSTFFEALGAPDIPRIVEGDPGLTVVLRLPDGREVTL